MRFPLDHVFHSPHFTLSRLDRLGHVESDHFPIVIELRQMPSEMNDHDVLENKESEREAIANRIDRAARDEDFHGDAVDENKTQGIGEVKEATEFIALSDQGFRTAIAVSKSVTAADLWTIFDVAEWTGRKPVSPNGIQPWLRSSGSC